MNKIKRAPVIGVIWKVTFDSLKKNPVIWIPFCISGILKLFGLAVIFLSIFYPLSIVFAPIIKTLWGEAFLHYPFNFSLMPKLFYYVQIAVYIFLDGLLSGMAVWMVYQANEGKKPTLLDSLKKVLPKYVTLTAFLLTIYLIVYFISYGENLALMKSIKFKAVAFLMNKGLLQFINVFVNFFIILLIETVAAFVIPFVVLEDKRYFKGLAGSFGLVKRVFFSAFILIAIPTLISLPFSLLKAGFPALINKTLPEITFLVLGLSVVVTIFIDCVVTTSLAFLFLLRKELA
ncbi:MAG: hypothetical protein KKC66_05625 [Candidatus Omnitrophica bacterium]|nr:hypothetical protein [Candidatus Omnitrophota bacterium]